MGGWLVVCWPPHTEYSPSSVEGEVVGNLDHVGPHGGDNLEPGREDAVMFGEECCESLPVVWAMLLRLTQSVDEDDGDLAGDLPLLVEDAEWLQYPGPESLAGVDVAVVDGELSQEVRLGLEKVVVGCQLGGLAQLPSQGLDELRDQAGGGVVSLAEMVGHQAGGEEGGALGGRQEEAGGSG